MEYTNTAITFFFKSTNICKYFSLSFSHKLAYFCFLMITIHMVHCKLIHSLTKFPITLLITTAKQCWLDPFDEVNSVWIVELSKVLQLLPDIRQTLQTWNSIDTADESQVKGNESMVLLQDNRYWWDVHLLSQRPFDKNKKIKMKNNKEVR